MSEFAPERVHRPQMAEAPKKLQFRPDVDYSAWRDEVRARLVELIGWMPERIDPDPRIEWEQEHEACRETRFVFRSEPHAHVPAHLLVPKGVDGPVPVVICLQGHSPGMHISLGRPKNDHDRQSIEGGDRDFAVQAVRRKMAALVLEQRCFGERKDVTTGENRGPCVHASMASLLLGRTMIGERCWDVWRAIDLLDQFSGIDADRVACMGNSGGGTITYFAAALDDRIGAIMPSCYVCTFEASIGSKRHCPDNYLPGTLQWFEMGDLACLHAPRPLVVVAGRNDHIFPIDATQQTYERIQQIYEQTGAADKCRLLVGEGGHRFYADLAWPVFHELTGW